MSVDNIVSLVIVIGAVLFFAFAVIREFYLDWQSDKDLLEYYKKIYTEMHK